MDRLTARSANVIAALAVLLLALVAQGRAEQPAGQVPPGAAAVPLPGATVPSAPAPAPKPVPNISDITDDARGERLYMDLCAKGLPQYVATLQQGRTSSDPLLSQFNPELKADREILRALQTYCGTGRFILGQFNEKRECVETFELGRLHADLIRRLMAVRPEPADLVAIGCIKTKELLSFWTYRAAGIIINQSEIERIEISGAQISYGVTISQSQIPGGIHIDATSLGRILEISGKSVIGRDGDQTASLNITRSALEGSLYVKDATFHGGLSAPGMKVDGSVEFYDTTFGGDVFLGNLTVGGQLRFEGASCKGFITLQSLSARSVVVMNLKLKDAIYARLAKIDGKFEISASEIEKFADLQRLQARQLIVQNSAFGSDADAASGRLIMTAANLGTVEISNTKLSRDIFAGNTRAGAFDLDRVTVPTFDCSDCIIDQYLTLGGTFSKEVLLWAAQIKSQLRLREKNVCARFTDNAIFDVRGLHTASIAADYDDLKIVDQASPAVKGTKCATRTVRTLISGAEFQQIMPGYRRQLPAQNASSQPPAAANADATCLSTGQNGSIIDQSSDDILCWINNGLGISENGRPAYDPRPYQLVAAALETAGRNDAAIDLRIEKVNAEDRVLQKDFWYYLKRPFKSASYYVSGYGYHNEWALGWFFLLVMVGFVAFLFGRLPYSTGLPHMLKPDLFGLAWYSLWFSVDRAVPPLALDTAMSEYSILKPWARNYFYLHRALGTLIITIAIASVTGAFK